MPELPEVEVTKRGVEPHILDKSIERVLIHQNRLRRLVPSSLVEILPQAKIVGVSRRAKYLLFDCEVGWMIIHLGMSGSLRVLLPENRPHPLASKHEHIEWQFTDGTVLRYRDPRRFGMVDWFSGAIEHYSLLQKQGVEPLDKAFNGTFLHQQLQGKKQSIKTVLMQGKIVVGVGNIYANEALFYAGIHPKTRANDLCENQCMRLVKHIKAVLQAAIQMGGSSLKDFVHSDGSGGYFQQHYAVYGKHLQPCPQCQNPIDKITIDGRSSFFCALCQKESS